MPGSGPKNTANTNEAKRDSGNAPPKVMIGLPDLISASVSFVAFNYALPNNIGEYHRPPRTNAEAVARMTPIQLTDCNASI